MDDLNSNLQISIKEYNDWRIKFKDKLRKFKDREIYDYSKDELEKLNVAFHSLFREISNLDYSFYEYKYNSNLSKGDRKTCDSFVDASEINVQRCQSLCIFPITFRLSELTSDAAKKFNIKILIYSSIIAVIIAAISFLLGFYLNSDFQKELKTSQNRFTNKIDKYENRLKQINDTLENNRKNSVTIGDDIVRRIDLQLLEVNRLNIALNKEKENIEVLNNTVEKLCLEINQLKSMPEVK